MIPLHFRQLMLIGCFHQIFEIINTILGQDLSLDSCGFSPNPHPLFLVTLPSVSLCSGCHNRVQQSGWLEGPRFIFLQFWGLKSQINVLAGLGFPGASLFGLRTAAFLLPPHMAIALCMCTCCLSVSMFPVLTKAPVRLD